jgi:hypothetical protein
MTASREKELMAERGLCVLLLKQLILLHAAYSALPGDPSASESFSRTENGIRD